MSPRDHWVTMTTRNGDQVAGRWMTAAESAEAEKLISDNASNIAIVNVTPPREKP